MIGDGIDWGKVRIWNKSYGWTFGFQGENVISPNGKDIFYGDSYRDDMVGDMGEMARLVHELVHVWQGQNGIEISLSNRGKYDYTTYLRRGVGWSGMKIEAQAELVTDLYLKLNNYRQQYGLPVGYSPAFLRSMIPFSVPAYDNKQPTNPWRGWP